MKTKLYYVQCAAWLVVLILIGFLAAGMILDAAGF